MIVDYLHGIVTDSRIFGSAGAFVESLALLLEML